MSNFSEVLKSEPIGTFREKPSQALSLVKDYLDEVLALYKKSGSDAKTELDEIVTDGLDANQVWWQAKMVVENVGSDILKKIQDLKESANEDYDDSDSSTEKYLENDSVQSLSSDEEDENIEENGSRDDTQNANTKSEELETYDNTSNTATDEENNEIEQLDEKDELDEKEDHRKNSQFLENPPKEDAEDEKSSGEGIYYTSEEKGLNDGFFDLDEFNRQTLEVERDAGNEQDDEEVDFFAELPSEDDEEVLYYQDFFDQPKSKKPTIQESKGQDNPTKSTLTEDDYDAALDSAKLDLFADDESPRDEENEEGDKLTTFEKQQLDIRKQIDQLEQEAVADKKWALKGEVQSKDRPQDALLEEEIEFDRTSKPVPVITKEVSESLEEMIRRRIQESNFDDLQRRVVTDKNLKSYKPDFQLNDQKSSKSLAEVYEDDYKGVSQNSTITEELQKEHDEISEMFNNLFYKLDALSSAHFIPKPAQKSLEVRVNAPAVTLEEAQPLTLSTEQSLAPQEVYKIGKEGNTHEINLKNGMAAARDELTREDKQRLRRAMKRKRAKSGTSVQGQERKKTKKDAAVSTLSKAANITVINKQGEKHDVRGKDKRSKANENIEKIRL